MLVFELHALLGEKTPVKYDRVIVCVTPQIRHAMTLTHMHLSSLLFIQQIFYDNCRNSLALIG